MKEPETTGQKIRRRRKALNLTQKGLAELLGIQDSHLIVNCPLSLGRFALANLPSCTLGVSLIG